MPTNNEVTHVTVTSVSTDDAVAAIETLWGHAEAYSEEVGPPRSIVEARQAKQALTRVWLERDALQEEKAAWQTRERQLLALFAWARGWCRFWKWDDVCRELFGFEVTTDDDRIDRFLALVEETTQQGRAVIDEAERKVKEKDETSE